MITVNDVKKFWGYFKKRCKARELAGAAKECGFDVRRLKNRNLAKLSDKELMGLYADMVYMALNGLCSGDFETMRDILSESLGLDDEMVELMLDF